MSDENLSQTLKSLLESEDNATLSVGTIVDRVGNRGFGLLLIILSLPSALPVPAAGYSVPFGILLFALGIQIIMQKERPVIPEKGRNVKFSYGLVSQMVRMFARFFAFIEKLIKPRFNRWLRATGGKILMGILVVVMAILMMIPIPTTNTFPAMVIFIIGVGITEEDGLFAAGACLAGILAVLLYIVVIYFLIQFLSEFGWSDIDNFKSWLKELLS